MQRVVQPGLDSARGCAGKRNLGQLWRPDDDMVLFHRRAWKAQDEVQTSQGTLGGMELETFRKDYQRNERRGVSIHAAMVQSRQCEASDPRDKVYALLGVCPELAQEIGEPDYSLSPAVVWARAQRACFNGRLGVNALYLVSVGERLEKNIPSWVPDLSTGLKTWPRRPPLSTPSDGLATILPCPSGQDS